MQLSLDDRYPAEAAYGADFFTRAAQGDVIEDTPDGPRSRRERVVITDNWEDHLGRVCIGERTARHLARQFGMVDGWKVDAVIADAQEVRTELMVLSERIARLENENRLLRELEVAYPEPVFLALDGTKHASERGCMEATARTIGVETQAIDDARRVAASQEEVTV